jgi:CheY-like chemotaxis protein
MSILLEVASGLATQSAPPTEYVKFLTEELARHRTFLTDSVKTLMTFFSGGFAVLLGIAAFIGWKSLKDVRDSMKEIFEREAKVMFNERVALINAKFSEISNDHETARTKFASLETAYNLKIESIEKWLIRIEGKTLSQPEVPKIARSGTFRILWVDDTPSNNWTLAEDFKARGMEVEEALDTASALEALAIKKYDLVISDMSRAAGRDEGLVLLRKINDSKIDAKVGIYAGKSVVKRYGEQAAELNAVFVTANPGEVYEYVMTLFSTS